MISAGILGLTGVSIYVLVNLRRRCTQMKQSIQTAKKVNSMLPFRGKPSGSAQTVQLVNVVLQRMDSLTSLMKDFIVYAGMYIMFMGILWIGVHARAICCAWVGQVADQA